MDPTADQGPDGSPGGGPTGAPGGGPSPAARAAGRARAGRGLAVAVALVEAAVVAAGAATALLSGLRGGSLVLGAAVAGVAAGVAWLLVEAARGFAQGRRWPIGIFVTAQLLVALVALSLGGPALLTVADNPRIGVVTLVALALAVAGMVAVRLMLAGRPEEPADGADGPPPVY